MERGLIVVGAVVLLLGSFRAWRPIVKDGARASLVHRPPELLLATGAFALAIALRWVRLGHGPFFNMAEILMSNLFSLGLASILAWRIVNMGRLGWPTVSAVLTLMAAWLLSVPAPDSHFAPVYDTSVLWFHVFAGKLFLGCALVALALAGSILVRRVPWQKVGRVAKRGPSDAELDALCWQWMRIALLFETAMLIAGAVWAQDAWGRYWAWDPLEIWAFVTWLTLVIALHRRLRSRPSPVRGALWVFGVFTLAFLTFFGVPFVTEAPHQGAI